MNNTSLHHQHPEFYFREDIDIKLRSEENRIFMQQWLNSPSQLGTCLPITVKLADVVARHVAQTSGYVVEIGAGTGRLTRSLMKYGLHPQNLTLVELDSGFCDYLNSSLPELLDSSEIAPLVLCGNAANLDTLLPSYLIKNVSAIVSAVPLMYLPQEVRSAIINSCFDVMGQKGVIYHVTYNPKSPISFMQTVNQERIESLWFNLPPAFCWKFTRN